MDRHKEAARYIESVSNQTVYRTTFTEFGAAISHVVLGDYGRALTTFDAAVLEMLGNPTWMRSNEPNCIVEAYALSARTIAVERIQAIIERFGAANAPTSPLFHYTRVLMGMLWPGYSDPVYHAQAILTHQRYQYLCSVARFALSVIDGGDIVGTAEHLVRSSKAHNRQRYGPNPRGFLCLPLMSILSAAESPGMVRLPPGDMYSLGYLDYRRGH